MSPWCMKWVSLAREVWREQLTPGAKKFLHGILVLRIGVFFCLCVVFFFFLNYEKALLWWLRTCTSLSDFSRITTHPLPGCVTFGKLNSSCVDLLVTWSSQWNNKCDAEHAVGSFLSPRSVASVVLPSRGQCCGHLYRRGTDKSSHLGQTLQHHLIWKGTKEASCLSLNPGSFP